MEKRYGKVLVLKQTMKKIESSLLKVDAQAFNKHKPQSPSGY